MSIIKKAQLQKNKSGFDWANTILMKKLFSLCTSMLGHL